MPSINQVLPVTAFIAGKDRQMLVNAGFTVWSRGRSITLTAPGPVADRWNYQSDDVSIHTLVEALHGNTQGVPEIPGYAYDGICIDIGVGGLYNTYRSLNQIIPNVLLGNGGVVTLSMWVYWSSWTPSGEFGSVTVKQHYSGGHPSVSTALNGRVVVDNGVWKRIVFSGALPAVDPDDISEGHCLELVISINDSGVAGFGVVAFAALQLNVGSREMPFCSPGVVDERRLCSEYFERIDVPLNAIVAAGVAITTNKVRYTIPISPKAADVFSVNLSDTVRFRVFNGGILANVSDYVLVAATKTSVTVDIETPGTPLTVNGVYWLGAGNSGAYITIDTGL